ncbi:hypothetical protein PENTCL1PPCAC_29067, partial [Pristionchus entomophagus]
AIVQVLLAVAICYFFHKGTYIPQPTDHQNATSSTSTSRIPCPDKEDTPTTIASSNTTAHEPNKHRLESLFDFTYTFQNLLFFCVVFMLTSAFCALLGSSVKTFPFLLPAIVFQILCVIVTSAAIGFSFLSDGKFEDNHPLVFGCTIICAFLSIKFLFVIILSFNYFRSIARRSEKYR